MTREQQQKLIKECFEQRMEIMRKKSEDYSNGQDVLSNFKGSGANIGLTAEMQILSLIATKVARLGVLLNSNKVPENESIDDSIKDLANYTDLLYCAVNEGKAKSEEANTSTSHIYGCETFEYGLKKFMEDADRKISSTFDYTPPYKEKQKSLITQMMESDEKDGLYEVPHKYPTEYHKAYAERKGKC